MFRKRWWLFGKTISDEGFAFSLIYVKNHPVI